LHRAFAFPQEYDRSLDQEEFALEFKIRFVLSTAPLVWRGAHFAGHTAFGHEVEQLISSFSPPFLTFGIMKFEVRRCLSGASKILQSQLNNLENIAQVIRTLLLWQNIYAISNKLQIQIPA
jgi:hypothetical protein